MLKKGSWAAPAFLYLKLQRQPDGMCCGCVALLCSAAKLIPCKHKLGQVLIVSQKLGLRLCHGMLSKRGIQKAALSLLCHSVKSNPTWIAFYRAMQVSWRFFLTSVLFLAFYDSSSSHLLCLLCILGLEKHVIHCQPSSKIIAFMYFVLHAKFIYN